MKLRINNNVIRVEVNASTLIIYEDRFKGRRLLKDLYEITEMLKDYKDIPFSMAARLLWAAAKTADKSTDDIYGFLEQFEIADIVNVSVKVIGLYTDNVEIRKKASATAKLARICQRLRFWRMRSNAD